jgi:hypothetical protein
MFERADDHQVLGKFISDCNDRSTTRRSLSRVFALFSRHPGFAGAKQRFKFDVIVCVISGVERDGFCSMTSVSLSNRCKNVSGAD